MAQKVYIVKKHERYLRLLHHIFKGEIITSDLYAEMFGTTRRTANRDLQEFTRNMYNEFGVTFDVEHYDKFRVYKVRNLHYVFNNLRK